MTNSINLRNMKGILISVEGPEFSGKTSIIKEFSKDSTLNLLTTFEPGATERGKILREWVTNPIGAFKDNQNLRAMGFAMDRAVHIFERIIPALEEGKVVITDRYIDSSYVLQGIIQNKPLTEIDYFNCTANSITNIQNILPLKTIYIDITEEVALERFKKRGNANLMDIEFMERFNDIRNAYLEIARKSPDRYIILNGNDTLENIQNRFSTIVKNVIKEYKPELIK